MCSMMYCNARLRFRTITGPIKEQYRGAEEGTVAGVEEGGLRVIKDNLGMLQSSWWGPDGCRMGVTQQV